MPSGLSPVPLMMFLRRSSVVAENSPVTAERSPVTAERSPATPESPQMAWSRRTSALSRLVALVMKWVPSWP